MVKREEKWKRRKKMRKKIKAYEKREAIPSDEYDEIVKGRM